MNTGELIVVEKDRVIAALRGLRLNLQRREELFREIGLSMLVSVRQTFREQGSPADSWVPLSPNTIRRDPKKYGPGHKILLDRGILQNSITFQAFTGGVKIGTNLVYAAVHQFGSRDRTGGAIGPQAKLADRAVRIKANFRTIHLAPRYERVEITRADGSKVMVPRKVFKETVEITNKRGHRQTVTRLIENHNRTTTFAVGSHARHQNIPARPFLVFRPGDSKKIRGLVVRFGNKAKVDAGLAGA